MFHKNKKSIKWLETGSEVCRNCRNMLNVHCAMAKVTAGLMYTLFDFTSFFFILFLYETLIRYYFSREALTCEIQAAKMPQVVFINDVEE